MESSEGLFIFVEGADDIRFCEKIIIPLLEKHYPWIKTISYARYTQKKINSFLSSIEAMPAHYIFTADIDLEPCVSAKKQKLQQKYQNIDENKTIVVVSEIESWYLAGLNETAATTLGLPVLKTTNKITKEDFNRLTPKKVSSRIDFTIEILKLFSIEIAAQKNTSFKYFLEKYR